MFDGFFLELRAGGVPVTLKEYLGFLDGVRAGVPEFSIERFYYLARASLVKDERHLDRFDRVFAEWYERLEKLGDPYETLPEEWLKRLGERFLTEEEKARIRAEGGWRDLMETLKKRLREQKKRHQGGSKWVGTGGTSPFGAYGYHPRGVRIGQDGSRHRRAVKVWDRREFENFDDTRTLGTRNLKVALRKLRRFAREGHPDELDLDGTIRATAKNGGVLDLSLRPARENTVKVLLLLDVGGSMDDHIRQVELLFSAARSEFKHLEYFYFHNCVYEAMWKDARRRRADVVPTREVLRTFGADYRVFFVGDASMSPFEITEPGGSVEHWNEEAGHVWMRRLLAKWDRAAWLNPVPERLWPYTDSIHMLHNLIGGRMHPLTPAGIESAVKLT